MGAENTKEIVLSCERSQEILSLKHLHEVQTMKILYAKEYTVPAEGGTKPSAKLSTAAFLHFLLNNLSREPMQAREDIHALK